jgi:integrase
MFKLAAKPQVGWLRVGSPNPFTEDIVGKKPRKDPVRAHALPMDARLELIPFMDEWELCQFVISLVLPMRPNEVAGLLISDVNFAASELKFWTRFGGSDFTKGRTSFIVPFPKQIEPILLRCVAGRREGPLLLSRKALRRGCPRNSHVNSTEDLEFELENLMASLEAGEIQSDQDRKRIFRRILNEMGGVTPSVLRKAFKSLFARTESRQKVTYYKLRSAVTTDMYDAGISYLALQYLTGHAISDTTAGYVSIDPHREMNKYFAATEPLLAALAARANALGIVVPAADANK